MAGIVLLGASGCAQQQGDTQESVVGQRVQKTNTATMLDFAEDSTFTGNDGCNSLNGTWSEKDHVITLGNTAMTLKACEGVDTWLSKAQSAEISGQSLKIKDAQGTEIGVLDRGESDK